MRKISMYIVRSRSHACIRSHTGDITGSRIYISDSFC